MYCFAISVDFSHLGLFLLEYSEKKNSTRLWNIWNYGRTVAIKEFVPTSLGPNYWVGEYEGNPSDIANIAYEVDKSQCLRIDNTFHRALLIPVEKEPVKRLREFIVFSRQFSSVLPDDDRIKNPSIGAAPYYNASGINSDDHLDIHATRETSGYDPMDIRGVVTTEDDFDCLRNNSFFRDWSHLTSVFSDEVDGRVRFVRTNCVSFVTAILSQYCNVPLGNIDDVFLKTVNPANIEDSFRDQHSTLPKVNFSGMELGIIDCAPIKAYSLLGAVNINDMMKVISDDKIRTIYPTRIPALG